MDCTTKYIQVLTSESLKVYSSDLVFYFRRFRRKQHRGPCKGKMKIRLSTSCKKYKLNLTNQLPDSY